MKVKELKTLMKKKKVTLLDVREKDEYTKGDRIKGAKSVPMGKVFVLCGQGKLPRGKIVVTCRSGTRCKIVAKELKKKGCNIDYLEGGNKAWKEA
jgi:rhodanese-related sulfurtransferase